MKTLFLSILPMSFLASCCSQLSYSPQDDVAHHHIGGDEFGAYEPYLEKDREPIGSARCLKYRFESSENEVASFQENRVLRERFNRLLDSISSDIENGKKNADGKYEVLLYFHGGLGKPKHGTERANKFLCDLKKNPSKSTYPIFVSWRSDAGVSLQDRYFKVRNGDYVGSSKSFLRAPTYLASDLASGIVKYPETLYDVAADSLSRKIAPWAIDEKKYACEIRAKYKNFVTSGTLSIPEDSAAFPSTWGEIAKEFGPRFTTGTARIVTTPLVQGVGTHAWEMMRRRAEKMFYTEADVRNGADGYRTKQEIDGGEPTGVVALLARRLLRLSDKVGRDNIEITLVGHSMGAIIANLVIREYPDLPVNRIIHMASADSVSNWRSMTKPWLMKNPGAKFYNLVLHPVNEIREDYSGKISLNGTKIVPRGSLLVWIDQMFTTPASVDEWRSGTWYTSNRLLRDYQQLGNAHLKMFPRKAPGCDCQSGCKRCNIPTTHSGFSGIDYLNSSVHF